MLIVINFSLDSGRRLILLNGYQYYSEVLFSGKSNFTSKAPGIYGARYIITETVLATFGTYALIYVKIWHF